MHQNSMEIETPKIRVMVVEDDIAASTFIAEVLKMEGYEPIVVNDSSKAMDVANSTLPQAILLDLMMPPPDGFKLCRMLRADPTFRRTPIMIVTALDNTDSKIVAIGAGANDYLVKPFAIDDLIGKVKYLLGEINS
jgi:DNA-binding response OmpR family regulator